MKLEYCGERRTHKDMEGSVSDLKVFKGIFSGSRQKYPRTTQKLSQESQLYS
jgi:hypothetical protein